MTLQSMRMSLLSYKKLHTVFARTVYDNIMISHIEIIREHPAAFKVQTVIRTQQMSA